MNCEVVRLSTNDFTEGDLMMWFFGLWWRCCCRWTNGGGCATNQINRFWFVLPSGCCSNCLQKPFSTDILWLGFTVSQPPFVLANFTFGISVGSSREVAVKLICADKVISELLRFVLLVLLKCIAAAYEDETGNFAELNNQTAV